MAADEALIAEQLRRLVDGLKADNAALRAELSHFRDLVDRRLECLEAEGKDHEERLRSLQDGVTSFRVWSGLASGGGSLMALAALVRTWFG